MNCPYCKHTDTRVVETRETEESDVTRRRRECAKCEKRFTTYERIEMVDLVVLKKDGTRQPFDREKMIRGMLRACEKRPIDRAQIDKIADEIEAEIRMMESTEIPSKKIGEFIMAKLKKLDAVAYVRFASVYREFTEPEQFMREIQDYLKKRK